MKYNFASHLAIVYALILHSLWTVQAQGAKVWQVTIRPEGASGTTLIIQYPIDGEDSKNVRVFEVSSRGLSEVTTYYEPKKVLEFKRSGNNITLKFSSPNPAVAQKSYTEVSFNPANGVNNSFNQYGTYGQHQGSRSFGITPVAKTDLMENKPWQVTKGAGLLVDGLTPPPAKLPKVNLKIRHLWKSGGDIFVQFHGDESIYFKPTGSTEFHRIETSSQSGFNKPGGDHFETKGIKDRNLLAKLLEIPVSEVSKEPGFLIDFRNHSIGIIRNVSLAPNVQFTQDSFLARAQFVADEDIIELHQQEFNSGPGGFRLASRTDDSSTAPRKRRCRLDLVK